MATGSREEGRGSPFSLSIRQIVVAGILGGIAVFLAVTRVGLIPVPNLAGNATIIHVPVILGAALEGPVVGTIVGLIFGVFSFIVAEVPIFRDPLVSVLPRLFIGVIAWAAFVFLKRFSIDLASAAAGVLGSLANTVGVLGMAVLRGWLVPAAIVPIIPQAIVEAILAALVTVVVVRGVMLVRSGRTTAPETQRGGERRY